MSTSTQSTASNDELQQPVIRWGDSECFLCHIFLKNKEGFLLVSCCHAFCQSCLSKTIQKSDAFQIRCPFNNNSLNVPCGGYLTLREVQAVVSTDDFKAYCTRSGHDFSMVSSMVSNENRNESTKRNLNDRDMNGDSVILDISGGAPSKKVEQSLAKKLRISSSEPKIAKNDINGDVAVKLVEDESTCDFCCEVLPTWEGIMLQICEHVFCRKCLTTSIKNSSAEQIKCLMDEELKCGGFILDREIQGIVTRKVYDDYKKRSEKLAFDGLSNIFSCQTKGCTAKCCLEDSNCKVYVCVLCNAKNCLQCKAIHDGLECNEYQQLLSQAIASGKDLKKFHRELSRELKSGFDQMAKKVESFNKRGKNSNSEYDAILEAMASKDFFKSDNEFDCIICFETVPVGQGIILQCTHCFCSDCMVGVIKGSETPQVQCPSPSCNYLMSPREIKTVAPSDVFEKYLQLSVQQAENAMKSFHCKTPDCNGWCEIENEEQGGKFICYICEKPNCLSCKAIHVGTCEDYQNRLVQDKNDIASQQALQDLVNKGEGMHCPTCKIVVQKIVGCDWLQCFMCKTELCWATKGPRWGPRGKGDISGGCKCKAVNNKLCTPKCGNCH